MKYPEGGQYIAKLRSGVVRTVWAADHADARRFFRCDRPVSVRKMDKPVYLWFMTNKERKALWDSLPTEN